MSEEGYLGRYICPTNDDEGRQVESTSVRESGQAKSLYWIHSLRNVARWECLLVAAGTYLCKELALLGGDLEVLSSVLHPCDIIRCGNTKLLGSWQINVRSRVSASIVLLDDKQFCVGLPLIHCPGVLLTKRLQYGTLSQLCSAFWYNLCAPQSGCQESGKIVAWHISKSTVLRSIYNKGQNPEYPLGPMAICETQHQAAQPA